MKTSDLDTIYKAAAVDSHEAGLHAVYLFGYTQGSGLDPATATPGSNAITAQVTPTSAQISNIKKYALKR